MIERDAHELRNLRLRKVGKSVGEQLSAIDSTPGVRGWLITNGGGEALATSFPAQFDQIRLDAMARYLFRANDQEGSKFTEIEIGFGGGEMLAKIIGKAWLVLVCQPHTDIAMARLTLSVAASTLADDRTLQGDPSMATRRDIL